MKIPEKFYKAELDHPRAGTVAELKKLLDELPDDTLIGCGFGEGVELVVYNHGTDEEHLELVEAED